MANGTLYLLPGSAVEGDILVVGGRLLRSEQVEHTGPEQVYWDAAPIGRTVMACSARGSDGAARRDRHRQGDISNRSNPHHAVARYRRHLQPSRRASGPVRATLRIPSLLQISVRLDARGILRTRRVQRLCAATSAT